MSKSDISLEHTAHASRCCPDVELSPLCDTLARFRGRSSSVTAGVCCGLVVSLEFEKDNRVATFPMSFPSPSVGVGADGDGCCGASGAFCASFFSPFSFLLKTRSKERFSSTDAGFDSICNAVTRYPCFARHFLKVARLVYSSFDCESCASDSCMHPISRSSASVRDTSGALLRARAFMTGSVRLRLLDRRGVVSESRELAHELVWEAERVGHAASGSVLMSVVGGCRKSSWD